jgi:hypothetical protein
MTRSGACICAAMALALAAPMVASAAPGLVYVANNASNNVTLIIP